MILSFNKHDFAKMTVDSLFFWETDRHKGSRNVHKLELNPHVWNKALFITTTKLLRAH